jgi:hypothetical protein
MRYRQRRTLTFRFIIAPHAHCTSPDLAKLLQKIVASQKTSTSHHRMLLLSFESSCKVYPSQTKILEGLTKGEMRVFEALFKGVSTRIWATNN